MFPAYPAPAPSHARSPGSRTPIQRRPLSEAHFQPRRRSRRSAFLGFGALWCQQGGWACFRLYCAHAANVAPVRTLGNGPHCGGSRMPQRRRSGNHAAGRPPATSRQPRSRRPPRATRRTAFRLIVLRSTTKNRRPCGRASTVAGETMGIAHSNRPRWHCSEKRRWRNSAAVGRGSAESGWNVDFPSPRPVATSESRGYTASQVRWPTLYRPTNLKKNALIHPFRDRSWLVSDEWNAVTACCKSPSPAGTPETTARIEHAEECPP